MYDLESRKIFVSRDVTFLEHEFPYMHKKVNERGKEENVLFNDTGVEDDIMESCVNESFVLTRKTSDEIEHGEFLDDIGADSGNGDGVDNELQENLEE